MMGRHRVMTFSDASKLTLISQRTLLRFIFKSFGLYSSAAFSSIAVDVKIVEVCLHDIKFKSKYEQSTPKSYKL
jgi:hypothetical protein